MTEPIWKSMTWYPPIEVVIEPLDMLRVCTELSKRNWHVVNRMWNDTRAYIKFEYRTPEERARLIRSFNIVDRNIGIHGMEGSGINVEYQEKK